MRLYGTIALGVSLVCALWGCNVAGPGTTRNLGQVDYASAFEKGREVMGRHFSIASADPDSGLIEGRPTPVQVRGERILGGSAARHLATLRIRRSEAGIVAHASVALQREGSTIPRTAVPPEENYDSVPTLTPAEETAAITPEQGDLWQTERYDHALQRRILEELYRAIHPGSE